MHFGTFSLLLLSCMQWLKMKTSIWVEFLLHQSDLQHRDWVRSVRGQQTPAGPCSFITSPVTVWVCFLTSRAVFLYHAKHAVLKQLHISLCLTRSVCVCVCVFLCVCLCERSLSLAALLVLRLIHNHISNTQPLGSSCNVCRSVLNCVKDRLSFTPFECGRLSAYTQLHIYVQACLLMILCTIFCICCAGATIVGIYKNMVNSL